MEVATIAARTSAADPRDSDAVGLELIAKVDGVISQLERHGDMTAAVLAEALGEPLSSIYRMLQSLTAIGWVDRSPHRGRYRLGLPLMTIGGLVEDSIDIRELARPHLASLLRDTNATSFLCVRRGARAVCVERLEGHAVRSLAMQLGSSLPLYAGAGPRALLAHMPPSEQEAALRSDLRYPGDPPQPAASAVEADLVEVRRRGYSISDGDVTTGIAALGAPVFNHRHELVASISISGLRGQVLGAKLRRNSALLQEAARATSRALGDESTS
jgi:DNA-binding IclR family transcriptional regulator